jgi:hypothetical protein
MHIYTSILLGSLLVTGLGVNSSNFEGYAQNLQQSNSGQQSLVASENSQGSDCPVDGQSSLPGCGRREA